MSKTSSTKRKRRSKAIAATRKNSSESHKRVIAAARTAVRRALKAHKAAGETVVVWKEGKVVKVLADEVSA